MRLSEITLSGRPITRILKRTSGADYDTYYVEINQHMYAITLHRETWSGIEPTAVSVNIFRRITDPSQKSNKLINRKIANVLDNQWTVLSKDVKGTGKDLLSLYNLVIFLLKKELEQTPSIDRVLMWSDEQQKNSLYHKLISQNVHKLFPGWEEDFLGIRRIENNNREKDHS